MYKKRWLRCIAYSIYIKAIFEALNWYIFIIRLIIKKIEECFACELSAALRQEAIATRKVLFILAPFACKTTLAFIGSICDNSFYPVNCVSCKNCLVYSRTVPWSYIGQSFILRIKVHIIVPNNMVNIRATNFSCFMLIPLLVFGLWNSENSKQRLNIPTQIRTAKSLI